MQFIDPCNPLLGAGPGRLDTGIIGIEDQKIGIATVRTPSTTVSVNLSAEDADNWADYLKQLATALRDGGGPSKLVAAGMGDVAAMDQMAKLQR